VLTYSTFLGGSGDDAANAIAVDASGGAYVAGDTSSLNFPATAGARQTQPAGSQDAFVTKLTPDGGGIAYSTYVGGGGGDAFVAKLSPDASEAQFDTASQVAEESAKKVTVRVDRQGDLTSDVTVD
jgi:hypothetical protein